MYIRTVVSPLIISVCFSPTFRVSTLSSIAPGEPVSFAFRSCATGYGPWCPRPLSAPSLAATECLCPAGKEERHAEPLKTQHPLNRGAVRTEQARNGSSMGRQDYYGNYTMIGKPGASPMLHHCFKKNKEQCGRR